MISFPNCKINTGLNILRRRNDGYHDIETVFYPLPLTDVLEIIPAKEKSPFTLTGLQLQGSNENNLCVKAYNLLKEKYPSLPPVQMHLHKIIPAGGGLGGGSADGAFALKILNEIFDLKLQQDELTALALQLGSDCPFFIINKPCYSTGRGELLKEINLSLSGYRLVVVNPGIHISTAEMFSRIKPAVPATSLKEKIKLPVESWREEIKNDFEVPVFELQPEIGGIKEYMYKAGAVYASLSGSGSSVYGIFKKEQPVNLEPFSSYFCFQTK